MQLSETVKLYPTEYQIELTRNTMSEYISTVNNIVSDYTNKDNGNIESVKEIKNIKSISKLTTADVKANYLVLYVINVFVTQNLLSKNMIRHVKKLKRLKRIRRIKKVKRIKIQKM